jgi:hypothetical protein
MCGPSLSARRRPPSHSSVGFFRRILPSDSSVGFFRRILLSDSSVGFFAPQALACVVDWNATSTPSASHPHDFGGDGRPASTSTNDSLALPIPSSPSAGLVIGGATLFDGASANVQHRGKASGCRQKQHDPDRDHRCTSQRLLPQSCLKLPASRLEALLLFNNLAQRGGAKWAPKLTVDPYLPNKNR